MKEFDKDMVKVDRGARPKVQSSIETDRSSGGVSTEGLLQRQETKPMSKRVRKESSEYV